MRTRRQVTLPHAILSVSTTPIILGLCHPPKVDSRDISTNCSRKTVWLSPLATCCAGPGSGTSSLTDSLNKTTSHSPPISYQCWLPLLAKSTPSNFLSTFSSFNLMNRHNTVALQNMVAELSISAGHALPALLPHIQVSVF